ncbi:hypothetical protein Tco_1334600 [Tanacetum coccineum]
MVGLVRLDELAVAANSVMLPDHMLVYIDRSVVEDSAAFLNDIRRRDVEKATRLLMMVKEIQLQTCKKVAFLSKLRFLNGLGFGGGESGFWVFWVGF